MLDTLTSDDFTPLIGGQFVTSFDEAEVALTLAGVEVMDERYSPPDRRRGFSLLLTGPSEPLLPQTIYALRHEALGTLDLFVVPLGPADGGQHYEVVFN